MCDDTLRLICGKIGDWKLVCNKLGCDYDTMHKLQEQYHDNDYLCCFHAIKTWRDTFDASYDDTVNILCQTLRTCGYTDCASTVYEKYRTDNSVALSDDQINIYCKILSDDWKAFCHALDCSDDFISRIEAECGHDNHLCCFIAIKTWRDTVDCDYADKIDDFCNACHTCGFVDIAVDCNDHYRNEVFGKHYSGALS